MSSKKKSGAESTDKTPKKLVNPWVRLQSIPGSVDRSVDIASIEALLLERAEAKKVKNYTEADRIATLLKNQHIAYHDEQKTWYTKAIPVVVPPTSTFNSNKKLTKKQERNRRQADKNKRKKSLESNQDAPESESESESESEPESEPVKPKKKKVKRED